MGKVMFRENGSRRSLSKFYSFNENSIQAVSEPYLWFSRLEAFNDPFEGAVNVSKMPPAKEWVELVRNLRQYGDESPELFLAVSALKATMNRSIMADTGETFLREMIFRIKERLGSYGYCCLLEGEAESPQAETLMWGHYGDGLRGFKICFDHDLLIDSLSRKVASFPVQYVSDIQPLDVSKIISDLIDERLKLEGSIEFLRGVRTKSQAWGYEREFRLVSEMSGPVGYKAGAIVAVVFGERMPPSQRKVIQSIVCANNESVEFLTARVEPGSYNIFTE